MRIRTLQPLFYTIGCLLLPLAAFSQTQGQPGTTAAANPAPEVRSLEKIVQSLQDNADAVQKKAKELLAVVETEAGAKRISGPTAQALRWSFRNLTASGSQDVRAPLATVSTPVDNDAIMKAAQALQDTTSAVRADDEDLMRQADHTAEKRCSDLVGNAKTPNEVDAFLVLLERLRVLVSGRQNYNVGTKVDRCIAEMHFLRDCFDLTPASDPATVSRILAGLTPMRMAGNEFGRDTDFAQRAELVLAPFKKAFEDAHSGLDAALNEHKSSEQIYAALAVFEDALSRYTSAVSFKASTTRDFQAELNSYRALCNISRAMESRYWHSARMQIDGARQSASQIQNRAGRTGGFDAILEKWGREISDAEAADKRQIHERIRTELGAVKQPSDLTPIVNELSKAQRDSEESNNSRYDQGLSMRLSALASAWENDDLNRLTNEGFGGGNPEDATLSADLAGLRGRAERDILSRTLKAPELVQPPLDGQPLSKAIDDLVGNLTAAGEWRRALQIMEGQSTLEQNRGRPPRRFETILAIRSYLAGQNYELAELWTDAAAAYKMVLSVALDGAPVSEAADRLKILAKEHPEEVKAARPSPRPGSPQIAP